MLLTGNVIVFPFHISQCPIDAQGIELHSEKKAGCSEKKGQGSAQAFRLQQKRQK
jgi:hypothetical protein